MPYCTNCGAEVGIKAKFCNECGYELSCSNSSTDLIYISGLKINDDQLSNKLLNEEQTGFLFCDANANLIWSVIEKSLEEIAYNCALQLIQKGKGAAVLQMVITPGQSATFAVEIDDEQANVLAEIKRFAFETGVIPDYLRKYAAEIIELGEKHRQEMTREYELGTQDTVLTTPEEIKRAYERGRRDFAVLGTPETFELLKRSATYPDGGIPLEELIGKVDIVEPAIILKKLPPNEQTRPGMQRVLMLDYEGNFHIYRIPIEALDDAEYKLENLKTELNTYGVISFAKHKEGFKLGRVDIRKSQKEALDTIISHFEQGECSSKPLPIDIQAILIKAQTLMAEPDHPALEKQEKADDSSYKVENSVEAKPTAAKEHRNLALNHRLKEEWDDAIAEYTKAIELNNNFTLAYYERGQLYKRLGKKSEAIADFEKVISLSDKSETIEATKRYIEELQK